MTFAEVFASTMDDVEILFEKLKASPFRSGFSLQGKELDYLRSKGMAVILEHAADFIAKRLAPALPAKDGKQTPWRGHPVFLAQHATATCCRGCLEKWHGIPRGQALTSDQQLYITRVLERWLSIQLSREKPDVLRI